MPAPKPQRFENSVKVKKKDSIRPKIEHFVNELLGAHSGKPGFVIGNGWSSTYYDTDKMRLLGPVIGCNLSFQKRKLDYLVFQDSKVSSQCFKWKGIKATPVRKARHPDADQNSTYFFAFSGQPDLKASSFWHSGHTGGLALQLACLLGCNPVFLVGCDCCLLPMSKNTRKATGRVQTGHRTNVFTDRYERLRPHKEVDTPKQIGKYSSVPVLIGFARKWKKVCKMMEEHTRIFKMGEFGIVEIPFVDIKEFWTEDHPNFAGQR